MPAHVIVEEYVCNVSNLASLNG